MIASPQQVIPIAQPAFGLQEEEAVLEVMRSGMFAQGPRVRGFEEAFAAAVGAQHAIATCNGTTALFLALRAHGVGPGTEVITTPLTFIASANAIAQTGARPVFADVDASLNIDPNSVEALITGRTRAILAVHLHGNPCDVEAMSRLAELRGIALLQDACQAVGATIAGRPLGTFGTAAYSFYATKNITTGEGGMIVTNDPDVARMCASLRHQAYSTAPYLHDAIGYNFRMTEMQAAIGSVQLQKLSQITRQRQETASYYDTAIRRDDLSRPTILPGHEHVYHQYTVRVKGGRSLSRDAMRQKLEAQGIGTGVYYPVPVHRQPAYGDTGQWHCPQAEQASEEMFSIPVHPGVLAADRERIAAVLNGLR